MPSYETTTSASEVLDEEKLKGPQESETSSATKESDEEKDMPSSPFASEVIDEDKLNGPQESETSPAAKESEEEKWEEGVSCSISPCLKEDGDYLCTNVLHTWPELRKIHWYRGAIDAGLAVASDIQIIDHAGMIERCIVCGPGFLKLKLSMEWIAKSIFKMLKGDIAAWAPKLPVKKAIIYFLSPNIAEEMHTGHLRSTVIGETLARILEYSGVEVIRRFHEGDDLDIKLKMMTEFLIEKSANGEVNDQAIGELEVLYKESKKRFDEDAEFKDRVQQSQGWDERREIARLQIVKISRENYQKVYQHLGVHMEEEGKRSYGSYISGTLDLLRKKGLTVESEGDKAIFIEGRKLSLVDLTALWHDLNMVKADWIVHVTDVGQREYFEMCIIAAKRAGWIVNDHSPCPLSHVGFGLVQADDSERFQTLSTKDVSLVNLFDEAKSRCKAVLVEQAKEPEHTAEALGYDAVKYAILKNNRLTNYTINFDEMLNEKEDTVVYLQYTHAQICSVLKKYKKRIEKLKDPEVGKVEALILKNNEERELGLHLLRFTEVLGEVCKVLMPHILCDYLYDLCKKFDNSKVCQVVDGSDSSKLLLCNATAVVMRKCFRLLGITPIYKEILKVPPVAEPAKGVSFSGLTKEQLLKVPPVAEPAIRVSFSDLTEEQLLKVPPVAEPAKRVFFSDLTEEQLMAFFCKGPCFRFELCNVLLRHNIDDRVDNGSSYAELRLFGIMQAETHISDPSHYDSFNIFKRNFDDPLVFNNPGSLSPHDICYCSLSVSTFVKITAKLYGTTYKGDGMESLDDYTEYYFPTWKMKMEMDKSEYLEGLKRFLLEDILPTREESKEEESKESVYIDDDAFEVCDDYEIINFSEYFAKTPNGGSGFCKLNGKDGYLELYYVALKYAVEATLEVHFAATSEETKVVGRVRAYYGNNFCYECAAAKKDLYSAMLFEIEQHTDLFVKPGKINLMRSVLAVPAQYSLIIVANLCDFTSGDELLSGVWEFLVPTDGSLSHGVIYGKNCSLNLKVDWKLPPDMPFV
ncbi:Aminoacyl-tRNA synthetase, class 1a, anticodon-binding [Artemisia annua]|uniref:arginine--tRNA ligase n=1 Tax=Artemisia annua TaxID=35608 RepID=A0A2U1PPN5_ARTAN|nr:Aminoacyl-tRNA synthetase, class 1a, anticodon-binding [Artemisia annua]